MDSQNHFVKAFREQLREVDETYLAALTNNGTYKRAVKDLAEETPVIALEENRLTVTFTDAVVVTFGASILEGTCTCPSQKFCRHRVTALLAIQQNSESLFGGAEEEPQPEIQFTPPSVEELAALLAPSDLDELLFRMRFGVEAVIKLESRLTITFPEEHCTTSFSLQNPLENSLCSCRSEQLCFHRIEALLHYHIQQGEDITASISRKIQESELPVKLLDQIERLLGECAGLGLARLPKTIIERFEQAALLCKNETLPEIEGRLRSIQGAFESHFSGTVSFSARDLRNRIASLALLITAVRNGRPTPRKARSLYVSIPPIQLFGCGAEGWHSPAYTGVTFYFYAPKAEQWFTYSVSRPTYYESAGLTAAALAKLPVEFGEDQYDSTRISTTEIKLRFGKVNGSGRISSAKESKAALFNPTEFERTGAPIHRSWHTLYTAVSEWLMQEPDEQQPNGNAVLIAPSKMHEPSFDKLTQEYQFILEDENGAHLHMIIRYEEHREMLLNNLKRLESKTSAPLFMGKLFRRPEGLTFFPISCQIDSWITNISLNEVK